MATAAANMAAATEPGIRARTVIGPMEESRHRPRCPPVLSFSHSFETAVDGAIRGRGQLGISFVADWPPEPFILVKLGGQSVDRTLYEYLFHGTVFVSAGKGGDA